jgi:hypothetical protein
MCSRIPPITYKKQPLCNILKKVKFKVENQVARDNYENIRGSSPKIALSIYTTSSSTQSHQTVPLRKVLGKYVEIESWKAKNARTFCRREANHLEERTHCTLVVPIRRELSLSKAV